MADTNQTTSPLQVSQIEVNDRFVWTPGWRTPMLSWAKIADAADLNTFLMSPAQGSWHLQLGWQTWGSGAIAHRLRLCVSDPGKPAEELVLAIADTRADAIRFARQFHREYVFPSEEDLQPAYHQLKTADLTGLIERAASDARSREDGPRKAQLVINYTQYNSFWRRHPRQLVLNSVYISRRLSPEQPALRAVRRLDELVSLRVTWDPTAAQREAPHVLNVAAVEQVVAHLNSLNPSELEGAFTCPAAAAAPHKAFYDSMVAGQPAFQGVDALAVAQELRRYLTNIENSDAIFSAAALQSLSDVYPSPEKTCDASLSLSHALQRQKLSEWLGGLSPPARRVLDALVPFLNRIVAEHEDNGADRTTIVRLFTPLLSRQPEMNYIASSLLWDLLVHWDLLISAPSQPVAQEQPTFSGDLSDFPLVFPAASSSSSSSSSTSGANQDEPADDVDEEEETDRAELASQVEESPSESELVSFEELPLLAETMLHVWGSTWALHTLSGRKSFSFVAKTRKLPSFCLSVERAQDNWQRYKSGQPILARTSREELRDIDVMLRIQPFVTALLAITKSFVESQPDEPSVSELHRRLVHMNAVLSMAAEWRGEVLDHVINESGLQSGDVVGYTLENRPFIQGTHPSYFLKLFSNLWLGSEISHLSMVVRTSTPKTALWESHLWGDPSKHTIVPFEIGTFGNQIYAFKPVHLIEAKERAKLLPLIRRAFPTLTPTQAIRKVFHEKCIQWHLENRDVLRQIENPTLRRIIYGLTANTVSPLKFTWRTRAEFESKTDNYQACSEFVIRTWLRLLDLTGQELALAINHHNQADHDSNAAAAPSDVPLDEDESTEQLPTQTEPVDQPHTEERVASSSSSSSSDDSSSSHAASSAVVSTDLAASSALDATPGSLGSFEELPLPHADDDAEIYLEPRFTSTCAPECSGNFNETWIMTKREARTLFHFIAKHSTTKIYNPLAADLEFVADQSHRHPSTAFFANHLVSPTTAHQGNSKDGFEQGLKILDGVCRRTERRRTPNFEALQAEQQTFAPPRSQPYASSEVPLTPEDGTAIFSDDLISPLVRINRYSPGHFVYALTTRRKESCREVSVPTWNHLFE